MKQVIRIGEEPKEVMVLRPIELTHNLSIKKGWYEVSELEIVEFGLTSVVYLGKCILDGDMFSARDKHGNIGIFKGHLNDGVY